MVLIEPIITQAITYSTPHIKEVDPSWLVGALAWLGIPVVTIDGQILPGTILLVMFAAWGVWHWILMFKESAGALQDVVKKYIEDQKRN